jgi:hypothetical protein
MNAVYDLFTLVNEAVEALALSGNQKLAVALAAAKMEARPEVKAIVEKLHQREQELQEAQMKLEGGW